MRRAPGTRRGSSRRPAQKSAPRVGRTAAGPRSAARHQLVDLGCMSVHLCTVVTTSTGRQSEQGERGACGVCGSREGAVRIQASAHASARVCAPSPESAAALFCCSPEGHELRIVQSPTICTSRCTRCACRIDGGRWLSDRSRSSSTPPPMPQRPGRRICRRRAPRACELANHCYLVGSGSQMAMSGSVVHLRGTKTSTWKGAKAVGVGSGHALSGPVLGLAGRVTTGRPAASP